MMWDRPNSAGHKPRWRPTYGVDAARKDAFLGYAGPFDVWLDTTEPSEPVILVIGPGSARVRDNGHNFDAFRVEGDMLMRDEMEDLHIGLDDMCLIYQLCMENNVFVREDPNGLQK
jgi:hypothetical protein